MIDFSIDLFRARALGRLVEAVYPQDPANQKKGHARLSYLGPTAHNPGRVRLDSAVMTSIASGELVDDPDLATKYVRVVDYMGTEHLIAVPDAVAALVDGRARIHDAGAPVGPEITVKLFRSPGGEGVSSRVYDQNHQLQYGHDADGQTDARTALTSLAESGPTTRLVDNLFGTTAEPPASGKRSVTVEVFTETGTNGVGVRVYDENSSPQCSIGPSEGADAQQALQHLSESPIATRYMDEHLGLTPDHR